MKVNQGNVVEKKCLYYQKKKKIDKISHKILKKQDDKI